MSQNSNPGESPVVVEKKERSVIAELAARHGMEKQHFVAALKATVVPGTITDAQFAAFCMVAAQYNLNPLTKEIYAFPGKGGGIVPIVSVDGWCNIINSNPQMNGMEFVDIKEDGKLVAITCKIHRKDRDVATECTEYMSECKRDVEVWKKWPARMLRHKSLIQCARYAFSLSGIYDEDEAARMDMVDVTPEKTNKRVFARKEDRNNWLSKTLVAFDNAETMEQVEAIAGEIAPTMEQLNGCSGENGMTLAKVDVAYESARQRVEAEAGAKLLAAADRGDFSGLDYEDTNPHGKD